MTKKINIELELLFDKHESKDELIDDIQETILNNEAEFGERITTICLQMDPLAIYSDDSFQINDLQINDSEGNVYVQYDWTSYYGCSNANGGGTEEDHWEFQLDDNKLSFEIEIPEIRRYDEI